MNLPTSVNWSVEKRLEFIEFRLFWEGSVRRSDIMKAFDVSEPQASKDLSMYRERAPTNARYDTREKRYVAADSFQPVFMPEGSEQYLEKLRLRAEGLTDSDDSWIASHPSIDIVATPARKVESECLRELLAAHRSGRSVEVLYQSMSGERREPVWRRITPHALAFDGFRWHTRAWCHLTERFKDFLLPRITQTREPGAAGMSASHDELWNEHFEIRIKPHPALGPEQMETVVRDYGMEDGTASISVRYAMLFYVLKRLGLLGDAEAQPPRSQHIVLANRTETDEALKRADFYL